LVGSLIIQVSFAKEPCKRDYILQKRHIILRSLLIVATPYVLNRLLEGMGWLRQVGSSKLKVSFAKEPCKRDYVLQKRPVISRSLLIVATP